MEFHSEFFCFRPYHGAVTIVDLVKVPYDTHFPDFLCISSISYDSMLSAMRSKVDWVARVSSISSKEQLFSNAVQEIFAEGAVSYSNFFRHLLSAQLKQ